MNTKFLYKDRSGISTPMTSGGMYIQDTVLKFSQSVPLSLIPDVNTVSNHTDTKVVDTSARLNKAS